MIPVLVSKMKEGYEMVISSRYLHGAKSYDNDIITAFGNKFFTKLVNILYRSKYNDALVMFRSFRKDLFERLELNGRKYPVLEILLCIRCAKQKLKVADISGDEPPGTGGALKKASALINDDYFIVMNRDSFLDVNFWEIMSYCKIKKVTTTIGLVHKNNTNRYGKVEYNGLENSTLYLN